MDTNEKRDIVLIYSEKNINMMVYKDLFNEAAKKMDAKIIYYESEKMGHITADFIKKEIPDFNDRLFYLSGSNGMVKGFEGVLAELKLPKKQTKVDYFPGF
jgi:ferredoxin-NADP reductase